ncbi:MAG: hypothetical protein DRN18_02165 [Thermoplasmata archaeon]|nr:MAG: hypothetical protein DRN18_02165 [Thermoplasmata archaeon]
MKRALKIIPIILLLFFILTFYIRPLVSPSYTQETEITEFSMIINSLITLFLLISIPLSWLYLIDGKKTEDVLDYLKIRKENLGLAIVYGIIGFSFVIFVLMLFGIYIKTSGEEYDNPLVKEIARTLSIPSIVFIALAQSSGEEVFFRGFLMEKLSLNGNYHIGIFLSSLLFGLAHLSYNQIYQVILPIAIGVIFGYMVAKSKNLLSSIIPHASYNLISLLIAHYISLTL